MKRFLAVMALMLFLAWPLMALASTDVNLNSAACIHEVSNVGSTTYVNICNNTQQVVAWGTADWLSAIFFAIIIGSFVLFMVGGLCVLLWSIITDRL